MLAKIAQLTASLSRRVAQHYGAVVTPWGRHVPMQFHNLLRMYQLLSLGSIVLNRKTPVKRYAAPPILFFRSSSVFTVSSVPKPPVATFKKAWQWVERISKPHSEQAVRLTLRNCPDLHSKQHRQQTSAE